MDRFDLNARPRGSRGAKAAAIQPRPRACPGLRGHQRNGHVRRVGPGVVHRHVRRRVRRVLRERGHRRGRRVSPSRHRGHVAAGRGCQLDVCRARSWHGADRAVDEKRYPWEQEVWSKWTEDAFFIRGTAFDSPTPLEYYEAGTTHAIGGPVIVAGGPELNLTWNRYYIPNVTAGNLTHVCRNETWVNETTICFNFTRDDYFKACAATGTRGTPPARCRGT